MSSLFGQKIPNRAVPTPPTPADASLQAARDAVGTQATSIYGRAATNVTGGRGAAGDATVQKKTLLGGAGG